MKRFICRLDTQARRQEPLWLLLGDDCFLHMESWPQMIGRGQEAGAFKFRPAEEVNFLSQYSSYFSRLKELGEEGPAHGLCFSVFLSSPGKMFCTDHFNL